MSGGQYRLEVAVKRLSHLSDAMLARRTGLSVLVHFADFPVIVLRPAAAALSHTPQAVAFHVCHRADFEAGGAAFRAPSSCACELVDETTTPGAAGPVLARWECLIPPIAAAAAMSAAATRRGRPYTTYMMRDEAGATVGAAEMDCRVFALGDGAAAMSGSASNNGSSSALEQGATTDRPRRGTTRAAHAAATSPQRGGTPYIVRVVVDKSASVPGRASAGATAATTDARREGGQAPLPAAAAAAQPAAATRANAKTTAAKPRTLLYLLQYDVTYQLQSMCDTLATTLRRREHGGVLASTAAPDATTRSLCRSLRRKVGRVVRLGNIVQQASAKLSGAAGTAAASEGTASPAETPRAPSAAVPHARRGTVAYCLTYDVLYQLRCVAAALGHLVTAHRDALALPLSALAEQHHALRDFCRAMAKTVQGMSRQLNILLVQTTLEPRRHASSSSSPTTRHTQSKSNLFSSSGTTASTSRRSSHSRSGSHSSRSSYTSSGSSSSRSSSSTVTSVSTQMTRKTSSPGERSSGNSPAASVPAKHEPEQSVSATPPQPVHVTTQPLQSISGAPAPAIPLPTPPPSPPKRAVEQSLPVTPLPPPHDATSTSSPPVVLAPPPEGSHAVPPPPPVAAFTPLAIPQLRNIADTAVPTSSNPPSLPIPSIPLPVPTPPPHT